METDDAKAKEIAGELEQIFKENMCFSNGFAEMRAAITANDIKGYTRLERGMMDPTTLYK